MAWFSRFTRYGDVHFVYGQERGNSCGMASIMMAYFKANKLDPRAASTPQEERVITTYETLKGSTHDFERTGAIDNLVIRTINQLDGGRWSYQYAANGTGMGGIVANKVGLTSGLGPTVALSPVMIGITWTGGGGHWAVVDTVRTVFGGMTATVCDPWDTNVHMQEITRGGAFTYRPGNGGLMVSLGGTHQGMNAPYDATSTGIVDAIIYQT